MHNTFTPLKMWLFARPSREIQPKDLQNKKKIRNPRALNAGARRWKWEGKKTLVEFSVKNKRYYIPGFQRPTTDALFNDTMCFGSRTDIGWKRLGKTK